MSEFKSQEEQNISFRLQMNPRNAHKMFLLLVENKTAIRKKTQKTGPAAWMEIRLELYIILNGWFRRHIEWLV